MALAIDARLSISVGRSYSGPIKITTLPLQGVSFFHCSDPPGSIGIIIDLLYHLLQCAVSLALQLTNYTVDFFQSGKTQTGLLNTVLQDSGHTALNSGGFYILGR
jgi:hypothetical protein